MGKHAFNELLSLKENYLIGKDNKPNHFVVYKFIEAMLMLLNPITPHFCQHSWLTHVVPFLKKSKNFNRPIEKILLKQGWPLANALAEPADPKLTALFEYLQDNKSAFRLSYDKAKSGGKKKNKKAKQAAPEEQKPIENCVIFVGLEHPEYKKQAFEILSGYEFNEQGEIQGDYVQAIRGTIKGPQQGMALKVAAKVVADAVEMGKEQALQLEIPFSEESSINENTNFLFENMPTIKQITVMANSDEKAQEIPNSQ